MGKSRSSGQLNFAVQISAKAKNSFEAIHKQLGFQRKGLTFEALVLNARLEEIVDPREIAALNLKLDHLIRILEVP